MRRLLAIVLPLALAACSVTEAVTGGTPTKAVAELEVQTSFVEFPVLAIPGWHTEDVSVVSVGPDILHIEDIYVEGDIGFTVDDSQVNHKLLPGHQTTIPVSFSPVEYGMASADLVIFSDDVDQPIVRVELMAFGWAPQLGVAPASWSFDEVEVGCGQEQVFEITNDGSGTLTILEVVFSPTSDEFTYIHDCDSGVAIGVDESLQLTVRYEPRDELSDSAYLWIATDDPVHPEAMVPISGTARYGDAVVDEFPIEDDHSGGRFELSEVPAEQTLEVELNGVPVYEGWLYDDGANTVVFAPVYQPDIGDLVTVHYHRLGAC